MSEGLEVQTFRKKAAIAGSAEDDIEQAPERGAEGLLSGFPQSWVVPGSGDHAGIVRARQLSHLTMANIRQNLVFAFIYNAAGIPIAAGILYPLFGIRLSPMIAAAAMALSSVSVITKPKSGQSRCS